MNNSISETNPYSIPVSPPPPSNVSYILVTNKIAYQIAESE